MIKMNSTTDLFTITDIVINTITTTATVTSMVIATSAVIPKCIAMTVTSGIFGMSVFYNIFFIGWVLIVCA